MSWSLSLGKSGDATTLAGGIGSVDDAVVAEIAADGLVAGERYKLSLIANDGTQSASAEAGVLVSDHRYALIPVEAGNLSDELYDIDRGDASGNLLLYSGIVHDPGELILFDRRTGQPELLIVPFGSNESVQLSGNGLRVFFKGSFRTPMGTFQFGLVYLDLPTRSPVLIDERTSNFYSVDSAGTRIAYQRLASDSSLQYFLWDEGGTKKQLTEDPRAIVFAPGVGDCPRQVGTTPLITLDGSTIVVITSATLGLVPEDPAVGCRVFSYDVAGGAWRLVATAPRTTLLDKGALTADGRWLSLASTRDLPNGIRRSFAALVDLQTGELRDPAVDVGDFTTFDAVVAADGRGMVISTLADLDPRVGNADHNLELFYYDFSSGIFTQISDTTGGVGRFPGGCPSYRPYVSQDGGVVLTGFQILSLEGCQLDGPQRSSADQFVFRTYRAVRIRPGNRGPTFARPDDARVIAGETLTLAFSAEDPDGDPISFFTQLRDGMDVPRGARMTDHHDGTATFHWPTRPEDAGTHRMRVAAFDEGGGEVFHDFGIAVLPRAGSGSATR